MGLIYPDFLPKELALNADVRREFRVRRRHRTAIQSAFNIGAYAVLSAVGVWVGTWWGWVVVWWFQGFVLSGFLGASHDCAHGTFARTPRGNHIAGVLWSSTVFFNFTLYKFYHLEHHKFTSVPGDTEPQGVFHTIGDYFRNLPTLAFFITFWRMSVEAELGRYPHFIRSRRARRDVHNDNRVLLGWTLLVVSLTAIWPQQVLMFYLAPLAVYFPMVFLTSLPEHYGCDEGPDVRTNVRSMSSNGLFRLIFWNGNYHAEHHLYPWVPSYYLPRLHRLVGHHFKYREYSYVRFHLRLIWQLTRGHSSRAGKRLDPLKRVTYDLIRHRRHDKPQLHR